MGRGIFLLSRIESLYVVSGLRRELLVYELCSV